MGKYIKFFVIIIISFVLSLNCFASNDTDQMLEDFLSNAPQELNDIEELSDITDKIGFDNAFGFVLKTINSSFKNCSGLLITYLVIVILIALLNSINFNNKNSIKNVIYIVSDITVVMLSSSTLQNNIELIGEAVETMKIFSTASIPIIVTLSISSGSSYSAALFSSALSFVLAAFEYITDSILLPLVLLFVIFGVMTNISNDFAVTSISNYIKKTIKFIIGVFVSLFSASLSLQTIITKSSDNILKRTIKTAVGSFVPIIGTTLSGNIDNLFAIGMASKTSFAVLGVIVIIVIFLPLIIGNLCYGGVVWLSKMAASMLGISKLEKSLGVIADTFLIISAICSACVFMVIASYLLICLG